MKIFMQYKDKQTCSKFVELLSNYAGITNFRGRGVSRNIMIDDKGVGVGRGSINDQQSMK